MALEIIEKMRMGVDYKFPVKLRDFTVNLRPLTLDEFEGVIEKVIDAQSKRPKQMQTSFHENSLKARETLILASTPWGEDPTTRAGLTHMMLGQMTNDELTYLYNEYIAVTDRVNPSLDVISVEAAKELLDVIKKNPALLIQLSFYQLAGMVRSLATEEESPTAS